MWKSISHSEKNPAGSSASRFRENQATPSSAGMINCFGFMHFHLLTEKTHWPHSLANSPANACCPSCRLPSSSSSRAAGSVHVFGKCSTAAPFISAVLRKGGGGPNTEMEMRADQTELKLRDGGGALTGGGRVQHNMSAMRYRPRYHEIFMVEAVQREIPSGAERKH